MTALNFVDTSIWFSSFVSEDVNHIVASDLLAAARNEVITSNLVVAELLTLLRARGRDAQALAAGAYFFDQAQALVHRADDADWAASWRVFRDFSDKNWSFVDCSSYAIVQRLGIQNALSLDEDFRQFGIANILP